MVKLWRDSVCHIHIHYHLCSSGLYVWSQLQVWSTDWGQSGLNPLLGSLSKHRCSHKNSGHRCCPAWSALRSGHEWCRACVMSFCSVPQPWKTHTKETNTGNKHLKQLHMSCTIKTHQCPSSKALEDVLFHCNRLLKHETLTHFLCTG